MHIDRFRAVLTAACLASITLAVPAAAQNGGAPLELRRLADPIVLDGAVDDAAWRAIPPLPLVQYLPEPGGPIRQPTEIRLAYDGEFLYASGRFGVPPGASVRANSLLRDAYAEDDYLNLIIDTFDDHESAVWFIATPAGTRIDGAISNDAEGPERQWNHREYDMAWDAASQRTPDGWSVEVRIPLASLRFQPHDGRVTMGIIAARLISDGKERYIFPAIRPDRTLAHFKPSLAARVSLQVEDAPRMRTLSPFVVLGSELRDAPDGPDPRLERQPLRSMGADLKLGLSSRMTLDLTANTDFAQAEADDQLVNLSRFSLFVPEKREFFLERASVFDFSTGGDDGMFYSRRIGLGADGLPVRVLGGGRLVGRIGAWDVGVLDLLTRPGDTLTENSAVVRVRRGIGPAGSWIGAMATMVGGGAHALHGAGGVDGTLRVGADDWLLWSAAFTSDTTGAAPGERSVVRAAWEHRRRIGLHVATAVTRIGESYAPALGYVRRPGTLALDQLIRFTREHGSGRIREQSLSLTTSVIRSLATHSLESLAVEPGWSATTTDAATAGAFVRLQREALGDTFRIGADVFVPPGTYDFIEAGAHFATPPGSLARVSVDVEAGRFYDGSRLSLGVSPAWNVSPHVELAADLEANRVWRAGAAFHGDVVRLRGRFSRDTRSSLTGLVQYNRGAGLLTTSLRFRHSWQEGTDLFIVLNDGRSDERRNALGLPSAAVAEYFVVKYVHTLR